MKLSEKGYNKVYEKCTYRDPDNIKDDFILIEKGMNPLEGECTLDELEFEPDDFEDFEKELSKFFFKLMEEQKPLPADMARILNEHFWELE